jgi:hypothetical protein
MPYCEDVWEVTVKVQTFLTWELNEYGWLASCYGTFTPSLGGPQSHNGSGGDKYLRLPVKQPKSHYWLSYPGI